MYVEFPYDNRIIKFHLHKKKAKRGEYPHDGLSRNIFQSKTFYDIKGLEETLPFLRPDSVVCDVGAMIGNHTVFWAPHVRQVYAIEPFVDSLDLLKKNIESNGLQNAIVIPCVASDSKGRWKAESPSDHKGPMHFVPDPNGEYQSDLLDNLLLEKVDLLKIDVEGAEHRVLSGAKRVLADHPIVLIEMHYFPEQPEYVQSMKILAEFGYERGKDLFVDDKWSRKHRK
jgi:FkbM family methyltransferase